jgi:hypothetical protein
METYVYRADYKQTPLFGCILACQLVGVKPIKFSLKLLHQQTGLIHLDVAEFPTMDEAIAYATRHDFQVHVWEKAPAA